MIIVSGCPRSGTSLMMKIMVQALGKERILGHEFPQEERKQPEVDMSEIAKYLQDKRNANMQENTRYKDMNPGGFFEMEFCTRGVFYTSQMEDKLEELLDEEKPTVCKIVSQGLARSDPQFIEKIVMMVRDPRAVAKSQERLGRQTPLDFEDAPEVDGKKQLIRSVRMFNQVTVAAATWLQKHSQIPVLVVNYDRLIDTPGLVMEDLQDFIGEGDFMAAQEVIDQGLRRSQPESEGVEDGLVFAMAIHSLLLEKDWDGIIAEAKAEQERPKEIKQWMCVRLGRTTTREACDFCFNLHEPTVKNYIKYAKGDWMNEPCAYECGIGGDTGAISVEESIRNNHWLKFAPAPCRHRTSLNEPAMEGRPCLGDKIKCGHPDNAGNVAGKYCNEDRCKYYEA